MRRLGLAVIGIAMVVGCGGGSPGQGVTSHVISSGQAETVPAGNSIAIGPFSLPSAATVVYVIDDMPTGIGSDTMDVAVIADSMVSSTSPIGYGVQQNIASASGTTPALPAGVYDLLVQCFNLIDTCSFTTSIVANY